MKQYYECHVTLTGMASVWAEKWIKDAGWTYSRIDGDPDLGAGVKQYATKHFNVRKSQEKIIDEMRRLALSLTLRGCEVLREKIELVIYDRRHK
jgi:hypothetical protein